MATQSTHLLVLVHGMWGNPVHMAELARVVKEKHTKPNSSGVALHVLQAETNAEGSTYDGIDWGGERIAEEILEEIKKLETEEKKVTHFSITGYSLGGLLSRYVIGILHQRDFFVKVEPVTFNTIATPHIGLLRYPTLFSSLMSSLGPKLLSRTGEQFFCADKWATNGSPLLEVMADPERVFHKALKSFKHIRIYANAVNDLTVPYVTAAIELEDPFVDTAASGVHVEINEEYPPLIKSYALPPVAPGPVAKPMVFSSEWFHNRKNHKKKPLMPPHLIPRFPLNLLLYSFLPLLRPDTRISLALLRLGMDSHSSRSRLKLLEENASSGNDRQKLMHIIAQLEQEVEGAITDIIDDAGAVPSSEGTIVEDCGASGTSTPRSNETVVESDEDSLMRAAIQTHLASTGDVTPLPPSDTPPPKARRCCRKHREGRSDQPNLTPVQKRIIANLNQLPITKVLAFFDDVRNAHGLIICRDAHRFEFMRAGANVVRHWADMFVL